MWDPVPGPEIKPGPPELGVQSLSHWTNSGKSLNCGVFFLQCVNMKRVEDDIVGQKNEHFAE